MSAVEDAACCPTALDGEADESWLVERARAGDLASFALLIELHQPAIRSYLVRLTRNPHTALDLTQDTFVRAFCSVGKTKPGLLMRPWLYCIATNLARDYHRRQRLLRWLPLSAVDQTMTADWTEATDERDLVQRGLGRLRLEQRAVLLLCGVEELPYSEAAAVLGASAEAVRKRYERAKHDFRVAYEELAGAHPLGARTLPKKGCP